MEKILTSKAAYVGFLVLLGLTGIAIMADFVLIPVVNDMFGYYPNPNVVNTILSGPAIALMIGNFAGGPIVKLVGKKRSLVCAFGVFALEAVLTTFIFGNATLFIVCRFVGSFMMGVLNVAAVIIIADIFIKDEKKLGLTMGIYMGASAGCGVILSLISGVVAGLSAEWYGVLKIYWITLPILVALALFLPNIDKGRDQNTAAEDADLPIEPQEVKHYGNPILFCLSYLVFSVMYGVINYLISVYLAEKGFGGAEVAGLIASLQVGASVITDMTFGLYFAKTKRFTITLAFAILGISFIAMSLANVPMIGYIFAIAATAMFGVANSFFATWLPLITAPAKRDYFMGILLGGSAVGLFISTYLVTFLQSAFNLEGAVPVFKILGAFGIIAAVVSLIAGLQYKKQMKLRAQAD